MTRIIVISDTHGHNSFIENEIERIGRENIHAIIHAGDYVSDADELEMLFPEIPMYNVAGNNDFYSRAKNEDLFTIDGVKIFLTHGHGYGVKYDSDYRTILCRGEALEADVVVFGHTHIQHLSNRGKLMLLNPGSAGYSKEYAIIEIENGKAKAALIEGKFM